MFIVTQSTLVDYRCCHRWATRATIVDYMGYTRGLRSQVVVATLVALVGCEDWVAFGQFWRASVQCAPADGMPMRIGKHTSEEVQVDATYPSKQTGEDWVARRSMSPKDWMAGRSLVVILQQQHS